MSANQIDMECEYSFSLLRSLKFVSNANQPKPNVWVTEFFHQWQSSTPIIKQTLYFYNETLHQCHRKNPYNLAL